MLIAYQCHLLLRKKYMCESLWKAFFHAVTLQAEVKIAIVLYRW